MFKNSKRERPFERQLPGGGYVAIEVESKRSLWRSPVFHGTVVVERRAAPRRGGDGLPIIATASGSNLESVVQELLPAAQCNATIGAALLKLGVCERGKRSDARRQESMLTRA